VVAFVVSAGTAAVLLAACSPSKGPAGASPSASQRALTKEEYVNQASVICSVANGRTVPPPATAADYAAAYQAQISALKDEYEKLQSLQPPAADKAKLQDQFLGVKARTIKVFEDNFPEVQKSAATGDLDATRNSAQPAYQQAVNIAQQAAPFLVSYGLDACS
jgi:hypothetical protein